MDEPEEPGGGVAAHGEAAAAAAPGAAQEQEPAAAAVLAAAAPLLLPPAAGVVMGVDVAAFHLQCSGGQDAAAHLPSQQLLGGVLAKIRADNVEAAIKRGLAGECMVQELARFRSQRHSHSIGMAFINEPMGGASAEFDGMPWQLALKTAVGVERATEKCNLVLSDGAVCKGRPGGTLHARLCQAKAAKRHDTLVHNRIKHTVQRLFRQYLRVRVEDEDRTPFIASGNRTCGWT
jgi:hypothetical protein